MTLRSWFAHLLPEALRSDAHRALTRAVADNVHANVRRRKAALQTTMAADTRAAAMDATIHRIEGRSGDRLTGRLRAGDAALSVAEATREFLEKRRP